LGYWPAGVLEYWVDYLKLRDRRIYELL